MVVHCMVHGAWCMVAVVSTQHHGALAHPVTHLMRVLTVLVLLLFGAGGE
jgi:hypothetical protein